MSKIPFARIFLFCLLLFPFAVSFAAQDELYLTGANSDLVFGFLARKVGPTFRPIAQFSYSSPTIEGTLSTITRNSSQFFILYPYAVNATKSGIRWDELNFNESIPQFSLVGSRNFPNVNPTSPFFFKGWRNGNNAGLVFVKNNDVVGKRFNVNSGNIFGGYTPLWRHVGSSEAVTGCVDPMGKYFVAVYFDSINGYAGVFGHMSNGHRVGNPVIYRLGGAIIDAECSITQPNGWDTILYKELTVQGNVYRTRNFIVDVYNSDFGIAKNPTAVSASNPTTASTSFFERFNNVTIRYNPDNTIGDYIFGKKSGPNIQPFIRHANSNADPIGAARKLYNRPYDTLGMATIQGLGTDE